MFSAICISIPLTPKRELWLLLNPAAIQFTHIVDFMVMMQLLAGHLQHQRSSPMSNILQLLRDTN